MAKTVRCNQGHFYDPERHTSCPHCGVPGLEVTADSTLPLGGSGMGSGRSSFGGDDPPTKPIGDSTQFGVGDDGATVGYFENKLGMKPVVGWLVCIDGADRGRDFRISSERNSIGRGATMDISIPSDRSISREYHAYVSYDPRNHEFVISPGSSSGLTYVNDRAVYSPSPLTQYDKISVGNTTLLFVPFCGDRFRWEG